MKEKNTKIEIPDFDFDLNEIPRIAKSRMCLKDENGHVHCHLNTHDDGNYSLVMKGETFPDLFSALCPGIRNQSPTVWKVSKNKPKFRCLWFPKDNLTRDDIKVIQHWIDVFSTVILLGLNKNIRLCY